MTQECHRNDTGMPPMPSPASAVGPRARTSGRPVSGGGRDRPPPPRSPRATCAPGLSCPIWGPGRIRPPEPHRARVRRSLRLISWASNRPENRDRQGEGYPRMRMVGSRQERPATARVGPEPPPSRPAEGSPDWPHDAESGAPVQGRSRPSRTRGPPVSLSARPRGTGQAGS
jgi:hypothetical protein